MNRTATRITLTASALLLGGAGLAPSAMATPGSVYPPMTPPPTVTTVTPPPTVTTVTPPSATPTPVTTPVTATPVALTAPVATSSPVARPVAAGSLAYTGAEVGAAAAAGLGLLVAGAALMRSGRRAPSVA